MAHFSDGIHSAIVIVVDAKHRKCQPSQTAHEQKKGAVGVQEVKGEAYGEKDEGDDKEDLVLDQVIGFILILVPIDPTKEGNDHDCHQPVAQDKSSQAGGSLLQLLALEPTELVVQDGIAVLLAQ